MSECCFQRGPKPPARISHALAQLCFLLLRGHEDIVPKPKTHSCPSGQVPQKSYVASSHQRRPRHRRSELIFLHLFPVLPPFLRTSSSSTSSTTTSLPGSSLLFIFLHYLSLDLCLSSLRTKGVLGAHAMILLFRPRIPPLLLLILRPQQPQSYLTALLANTK